MDWLGKKRLEMSGIRFLLDTNAITALLQGNQVLVEQLKTAEWVGISIINQIEFLANPALNEADKALFRMFLTRIEVLDLRKEDEVLLEKILTVRTKYRLKLPDAIIAATAILASATLVSSDEGFANIAKLKVASF